MPTIQQLRDWYLSYDPVHGIDHVLRVYRTAEQIALAEGADLEIVQTAALLHDVEGSAPDGDSPRAEHHLTSANFAKEILKLENWSQDRIEAVLHCIRTHRYRPSVESPQSLEAKVLFDADKLDVLGAIGVARTIAFSVLAHQPIYTEPSKQFLTTGEKEEGEPHSSYHEYLFKLRKVKNRLYTATAKEIAENRHTFMVSFFEHLVGEERGKR
jgi:uncharacterized protein